MNTKQVTQLDIYIIIMLICVMYVCLNILCKLIWSAIKPKNK